MQALFCNFWREVSKSPVPGRKFQGDWWLWWSLRSSLRKETKSGVLREVCQDIPYAGGEGGL